MALQTVRFLCGASCHIITSALRKFYQFYSIGSDIKAKQAEQARRNRSGRIIGGRSVWGNLIAPVAEKYHWTFDYVVWGLSFVNLQMLAADSQEYFTDVDSNTADSDVINADDPNNIERMSQLLGWK